LEGRLLGRAVEQRLLVGDEGVEGRRRLARVCELADELEEGRVPARGGGRLGRQRGNQAAQRGGGRPGGQRQAEALAVRERCERLEELLRHL